MKYKAMPGSIIIRVKDTESVSATNSGLIVVNKRDVSTTEVAEVLSVGDERDDLKPGSKILFPTATGLKIDKGVFYLKYEDICAIIEE